MSHILMIAEKRSQAEKLAEAFGLAPRNGVFSGHYKGRDIVVCFASGHLLELTPPLEAMPNFTWDDPRTHASIPRDVQLRTIPDTPAVGDRPPRRPGQLLNTIKSHLAGAAMVVGACDLDREGETIYRNALEYLGYRGTIKRLWFSKGLGAESLHQAFDNMVDADAKAGFWHAGMARRRVDYGSMVATATYTYYGRRGQFGPNLGVGEKSAGTVSVGRVQSAALQIVHLRHLEITQFVPVTHHKPHAKFQFPADPGARPFEISADYQPSITPQSAGQKIPGVTWKDATPDIPTDTDSASSGTDDDDNDAPETLATPLFSGVQEVSAFLERLNGAIGKLTHFKNRTSKKSAPLTFSQTDLAGKMSGMSAADTLATSQTLYEDGFLSYPRTEDRELDPKDYNKEYLSKIFQGLAQWPEMASAAMWAYDIHCSPTPSSPPFRPACYVQAERAHDGLAPVDIPAPGALSGNRKTIFLAVAKQFIQAHLPAAVYQVCETTFTVPVRGLLGEEESIFSSNSRVCTYPGWESAFSDKSAQDAPKIPNLYSTPTATIVDATSTTSTTTKPAYYNDATLSLAMRHAAKFEPDPVLRERLKLSKGIGTPATRPPTLSTLLKRGYIAPVGRSKSFDITPKGIDLLKVLSPGQKSPGTTAAWEDQLIKIEVMDDPSKAKAMMTDFVDRQMNQLENIIRTLNTALFEKAPRSAFNPNAPVSKKMLETLNKRAKGLGLKVPRSALVSTGKAKEWLDANPWIVTDAMKNKMGRIKSELGVDAPPDALTSFSVAIEFLGKYADKISNLPPSQKAYDYALKLAQRCGIDLPPQAKSDWKVCGDFIKQHESSSPPTEKMVNYLISLAKDAGITLNPKDYGTADATSKNIEKMKLLVRKQKKAAARNNAS